MIEILYLKEEDLKRPEIIEATKEYRVVLLREKNDVVDQVLIDNACEIVMRCKSLLVPYINMNHMRLYVNEVYDGNAELFCRSVRNEKSRARYLCQLMGAMMEQNMFCCGVDRLSRLLAKIFVKDPVTTRRYLYQGKRRQEFVETFSRVNARITKNHSDLCSVNQ